MLCFVGQVHPEKERLRYMNHQPATGSHFLDEQDVLENTHALRYIMFSLGTALDRTSPLDDIVPE